MTPGKLFSIAVLAVAACSCAGTLKDGDYSLTVLSTNDVHGCWFDSSYVDGSVRKSIFAVNTYVDSTRKADGSSNVLLLDAGDCLQGDNAAYYYNYVETSREHLFSRIMNYMDYDAVAVGNHDVETGHPVYDRVSRDLMHHNSPFLAGNAIRNDNGKPYFPLYTVVKKAGLRIAVLGYTNANIKAWLSEDLWSGMHFESIASIIQRDVDAVRKKEKPDIVAVTMHSACGRGDGSILEAEALDAFNSVKGVDWLICGHDHRPYVETREESALLNSGSHCRYLAHGKMHFSVRDGAIVSKSFEADLIPVDPSRADTRMRETFREDFEAVKAFTLREVGTLTRDVRTSDSFCGQSDYLNIIHEITFSSSPAEISIAAPLTFDKTIKAGKLVFNDLFTIYPFENQLYLVSMTGEEIRRYLEVSYDRWIQTGKDHILKIVPRDNPRTGEKGWSFVNASYNFDSAAGINYTVDVAEPFGRRVSILSMASGAPFDPSRSYKVGMTSYRASGGGNLLSEAGIEPQILERYPEIRNLLYEWLRENPVLDPSQKNSALGTWEFIPSPARKRIVEDAALIVSR